LAVASSAGTTTVTAYLYEISIAGTFGEAVRTVDVPASSYPFPTMLGGSFDGVFVYDSWASRDSVDLRFPFVSVNINIRDRAGTILETIITAPNNFLVLPTGLHLFFGPGTPLNIDDLRLRFTGDFTLALPPPPPGVSDWESHTLHVLPPPPTEIVSAVFSNGTLVTRATTPFDAWALPVTDITVSHTGTTPYQREVAEPGSTLGLFSLGLFGLAAARRKGRAA
jgi:hypothetical protein